MIAAAARTNHIVQSGSVRTASAPARVAADSVQPQVVARVQSRGEASGSDDRIRVTEIQRSRLLSAAGQVACEQGIFNVTVGQIVSRAGVSRRTFYEIFNDSQTCSLAVLHDALKRAEEHMRPAWESSDSWRERVRNALIELLCFFDEDSVAARLLLVESLGAGHGVLAERARVLESITETLDTSARAETRTPSGATRLSMEGAIGGALGILQARVTQPTAGPLVELAGPLMGMLTMPYYGPAAARREVGRTAPSPRHRDGHDDEPLRSDPFKEAGMRLTYRTTRVLSVVANHPGASNKYVGDLAEMTDPGQISKLLSRLERLGLIANAGGGRGRGEPNAWSLTDAGRQVTKKIRLGVAHAEEPTWGGPR